MMGVWRRIFLVYYKANEVTIDRSIQLCRKSTTINAVKAELTAATFWTTQEVIGKLITCNDGCVKDKRILRYQEDGNRGRGGYDIGRENQAYRGSQGYRGGRRPFNNYYYGSEMVIISRR